MPCMGPSEPTEKQVQEMTDEVMSDILEKNGLWKRDISNMPPGFQNGRDTAREKLQAAIYEILWQENCEHF